ncbi:adhesion G-protein coupled receptor V1-like [Lineus longissimus]|uniref:adhesion G-protein coupled receptor V1-like n=1 Tax=Lineus longissimus TaxID=88925 RepID=UPI00315D6462
MSSCLKVSLLFLVLLGPCYGQVVVITTPQIDVKEGDQFPVKIKLMGETSDELSVVVRLSPESDPADFEGTSLAWVFKKGAKNEEVELIFTTKDDKIPEKNETFILELLVIKGPSNALVGDPSKATVIILANDDAFGVIGFADPSAKSVEELIGKANPVSLTVKRTQGLFGSARVAFQFRFQILRKK